MRGSSKENAWMKEHIFFTKMVLFLTVWKLELITDVRLNKVRHKKLMTSNFIRSSVIYMEKLDSMRFWCKLENFAKSAQIWSQHVRLVLTKKTSTHTLCFWPWTMKLLGVESGKIMPHVRHCCWTSPDVNEPYAHRRCASDERLIFYNITPCYGKRVTVFAIAIAAGDIIKYQLFVYGSFVWGIHVRYNNIFYYIQSNEIQKNIE